MLVVGNYFSTNSLLSSLMIIIFSTLRAGTKSCRNLHTLVLTDTYNGEKRILQFFIPCMALLSLK